MTTFLLVMIVLVSGVAACAHMCKRRSALSDTNCASGPVYPKGHRFNPILIGYGAKPRIRKMIDGLWVCSDSLAAGYGMTPQEAYKVYSGRLAKNPTGEWRDIEVPQ